MDLKKEIMFNLSQYLERKISQKVLAEWAINKLHEWVKGPVLNVECLVYWGIITELAGVGDIDGLYCDDRVSQFLDTLLGKRHMSFSFVMKIPTMHIEPSLFVVKKIIKKYFEERCLLEREIQNLKKILEKDILTVESITEMLESQMIELLKVGYDFTDESNMCYDLKKMLFVDNDEEISEDSYLVKILALLDCCVGDKSFFVHVSFNNGVGIVSVQI